MFERLFAKEGLSIERLKTFCLVAEAGGYTAAAKGDSSTQSKYSHQVKFLEEFFGTKLFSRSGKSIQLTDHGKELQRLSMEYFKAFEDYSLRCSKNLNNVTIGTGDSLIQWLLLPRLRVIKKQVKNAELVFRNLRTQTIVKELQLGSLTYGIIRSESVNADLESINLGKVKFALFGHSSLGLEKKKITEKKKLSAHSLAGMEGTGRYQTTISEIENKLGISIDWSVKCASFPMMAKAVRVLPVASILPVIAEDDLTDEDGYSMLQLRSLKPLEQYYDYSLVWSKNIASLDDRIAKIGKDLSSQIKLR
ncbi:LysR family transcriptional regulator [bacterium]|nr:LysR family transcriptional regulator [bacterium]